MAPLRSSRSTRNQDHAAAARSRTGIVDLDPTDGLPVTKWSQISIRLNQDTDFSAVNSSNTGSADWGAQFNTPQFPWPEPPLPTYLKDLPVWNQEMIRRARAGNTENKLSIWDRKRKEWISAAEAEKKTNDKTLDPSNQDQSTAANGQDGAQTSPKSNHGDDDSDSRSDDEHMQDEETTPFKTPAQTPKRRKTAGHLEPRVFEVKKWVQVPMSIAEKTADPKFLADRRPGMPALYNPTYQNAIFGAYLSSNQIATANYDLGDGGGLGNAAEMLEGAPAAAEPEAPPVRRNMPPKRKKKKIGGPGRKKATVPIMATGQQPQVPEEVGNAAGAGLSSGMLGTAEGVTGGDVVMADADVDEASGSESASEGEGSEEGEIGVENSEEKKNEERAVLPIPPEEPPRVSPPRSPQLPPDITASALHAEQEQSAPVAAPESASEPLPVVEPLPEPVSEIEQVPIVSSALVAEEPVAPEPPVVEPLAVPEPVTVSDPAPIEVVEELVQPVDPADKTPPLPVPVPTSATDASIATSLEAQVDAAALEQEEAQTQTQTKEVPEVPEVDLLGKLDANIDQDMAEKQSGDNL